MEFVLAFDAWMHRASLANAGESVTRLRLLNELHCNGPRKMADLADCLDVTPRNITALVDALEGEDQVRRVAHPTDRRITMVELTGGSATVEERVNALRRAITDLFDGVPEADREAFAGILVTLGTRIEGSLVR